MEKSAGILKYLKIEQISVVLTFFNLGVEKGTQILDIGLLIGNNKINKIFKGDQILNFKPLSFETRLKIWLLEEHNKIFAEFAHISFRIAQ